MAFIPSHRLPPRSRFTTPPHGCGQGQLSFSGHGSGSSAGESSSRITPVQMQHQHQPTTPPPPAQTPHAHSQTQTQTQPATPSCSTSFSPKQAWRASFPPKRAVAISHSESHCHSVSMNLISPNQTQGQMQTLRKQSGSQPQGQRQGGLPLPPPQQGTISPAETQRRAPSSSPASGGGDGGGGSAAQWGEGFRSFPALSSANDGWEQVGRGRVRYMGGRGRGSQTSTFSKTSPNHRSMLRGALIEEIWATSLNLTQPKSELVPEDGPGVVDLSVCGQGFRLRHTSTQIELLASFSASKHSSLGESIDDPILKPVHRKPGHSAHAYLLSPVRPTRISAALISSSVRPAYSVAEERLSWAAGMRVKGLLVLIM
ncbi:hypothetical protein B0H11DRAFT_1931109 [Mycena galericulata]|nr:hypothetical protein B0H11DRAFT_1931109 [Mycena galericulata]